MVSDVTNKVSRLNFVVQQLARYGGEKRTGSEYTLIVCPFHADHDPSCRVYHSATQHWPGNYRCYGCGARGKWDELAVKLRLEPFKQPKPKDEYAVELKFELPEGEAESSKTSGKSELRIVGDLPNKRKWRTFSTDFLREELGAKLCRVYYKDSDYLTPKFVYFPCVVRGKVRGYIRARLRKVSGKPSFLNSSGPWSLKYGLFPYDYAIKLMRKLGKHTIVLVEGPRDALRLLCEGIPAMAILGTQSWADMKSRILELGGVDNVILFMDGDKAGRDAMKMLMPKLSTMFNVKSVRLPIDENEYDPGNCPKSFIDKLKRRFECLS